MAAIPSRERDVGHRHERWGGERWTQAASSRMAVQGGSLGFREHRPARRRATRKRTAKPCGPGTRCWCQIVGGVVIPTGTDITVNPAMTVTKRNSSPGRARRKPLKPLRRECRVSGEPVVTTVCYLHYAHGLRVQRAPGISLRPHFFGADVHASFGRNASRKRQAVSWFAVPNKKGAPSGAPFVVVAVRSRNNFREPITASSTFRIRPDAGSFRNARLRSSSVRCSYR
jgi:hypothetical protein